MKSKKFITFIAALGLLACIGAGSLCAFAQSQPVGNACLSVTGSASVEADAEICTFSGCVEAVGNDMHSAEETCAKILHSVKDIFAPYGNVREEHSSAYPSGCGTGCTASVYLTFITEKTDKAEEVRAALAKAGVTCLEGIRYSCKDDDGYKLEALQKAIENAREKAKALGAEGELVHVEEQCCYPCARSEDKAGKVTYTATVRAVFAKSPHNSDSKEPETKPAERQ